MHYLPQRREAYAHPRHVLDGAQSVVMLGIPYDNQRRMNCESHQGKVARYAWGSEDYHDWIHRTFKQWLRELRSEFPEVQARGVVDTAPLLERDFARLAGLGWVGKNTMLINKRVGSYFLLAAILVDQILPYDQPHMQDHCGTCTRCLDACPTSAFPQAGVLDARRCLSYWTIESKEAFPLEIRQGAGDWFFGCDICQDVCPWNRHAPPTQVPAFQALPESNPLDLLSLFSMDDSDFRDRFRKTPLWRSKRAGLLRNAAIVLGNQRAHQAVPLLVRALVIETDLPLRQHCLWALGRIGNSSAINALRTFVSRHSTLEPPELPELPTLMDEAKAALEFARTAYQ